MSVNRTLVVALVGLFSFLFSSSSKAQSPEPKPNPSEMGRLLRLRMLTTAAEEAGVRPTDDFPRVYAVLMDWPIDQEIATVFSTSTGAASLYTTTTFGIIGGEGHEAIRMAAKRFVRAAHNYVDSATPTAEYPYPDRNHVRFYLLTHEGVRVIETELSSISSGKSPHADLFGLGQEVLTELRLVSEKHQ